MTQRAVAGPFGVANLSHQAWLDPMGRPGNDCWREHLEGPQHLPESIELPPQLNQRLGIKPGPDLAGEVERAGAIVVTEDKGAEAKPRSGRVRETDDHELLTVRALDFEPASGAASLVRRRSPLGNDPCERHRAGAIEESRTLAKVVLAEMKPRECVGEPVGEQLLAILQGTA